jgi:elongator complex protein 3
VHEELARRGQRCGCIRCREIRRRDVQPEHLTLQVYRYATDLTDEYFLQFVTNEGYSEPGLIAGFLRLSLPLYASMGPKPGSRAFLEEIADSALIREVHVYGPALSIGDEKPGAAQHVGLGTQLLDAAQRMGREAGFKRLSVIAATGTRAYYAGRGFTMGELYMHKEI